MAGGEPCGLVVGFLQALSGGSEEPSLRGRGLAAPWSVSPCPWTIPFQHLSVCLLEFCGGFFNFLNDSNYFSVTWIYFPF